MVPKRPCRVCRKWFQPNPRAGNRQKVCSEPACQRERHRRNCAAWRQHNPDYDRGNRLRERLKIEEESGPTVAAETESEGAEGPTASETESRAQARPRANVAGSNRPRVRIDWNLARDLVGLELSVLIMELSEVLVDRVQDAVMRELLVSNGKFARHGRPRRRDGFAET